MAQQCGSLFEVWLGPRRHVIVTDPDEAKKLLSLAPCSRPKAFRQKALKYLGTTGGLFFMEGDEWSRHRRMLSPLFTAARLRDHVPAIVKHTGVFVRQLAAIADGKQSLDIDDKVQDLTLDILGETHLGMQFDALQHPEGNPVKTAVKTRLEGALRRHLSVGVDFRTWYDRAEVKRFNAAVDYLNRLAMAAVAKCRNATDRSSCGLMGLMAEARDENTQNKFSDDELVAEFNQFLTAGYETTSHSIAWAVYLLALHPEAQDKLAAAVMAAAPTDDDLTYDNVRDISYLTSVLAESARIFPATTVTGRENNEPLDFMGHNFPAGTVFLMSTWTIHRDPRLFPEPEQFRPERFEQDPKLRDRLVHFGAGPRMCLGMRLADLEQRIILSMLVRRFRWTLDESHPVRDKMVVVLGAENGIWIKLTPRNPTA